MGRIRFDRFRSFGGLVLVSVPGVPCSAWCGRVGGFRLDGAVHAPGRGRPGSVGNSFVSQPVPVDGAAGRFSDDTIPLRVDQGAVAFPDSIRR